MPRVTLYVHFCIAGGHKQCRECLASSVFSGDPGVGSFTDCGFTNTSFSVRTDSSSPVDVLHGRSLQDGCSIADNPDFFYSYQFSSVVYCMSLQVFAPILRGMEKQVLCSDFFLFMFGYCFGQ